MVHEATAAQVFGGMRGIPAMVTETSALDANSGIKYRQYSLKEANEKLPKAPGGEAGLPEAAWWLLLTGEIPTEAEVADLNAEFHKRGQLTPEALKILDSVL